MEGETVSGLVVVVLVATIVVEVVLVGNGLWHVVAGGCLVVAWWLVAGGRWMVVWLVVGNWWLMAGGVWQPLQLFIQLTERYSASLISAVVVPDGPRWPQMAEDGFRWPKMVPDGPK